MSLAPPLGRVAASLVVAAVLLAACSTTLERTSASEAESRGPLVVTTVSPLTNLAANVVCNLGEVVGLVPEGVDSHTFQPAPSTAFTLAEADIVFVNGLNLELPTSPSLLGIGSPITEVAGGKPLER